MAREPGADWLVAQGLANKPFDRALEYNAHALAQLVGVQKGMVQFNLPQPASEILRADDSDVVYYQVKGVGGEFLSGERELPAPPSDEVPMPGEVRLRDAELRGIDIRVAYIWVRLPLKDAPLALVQVAETREKRSVLATEIIKGVMLPQFVILPLAVLLVWLALARGIQPLNQLEQRIRARNPDDLSPLDDRTVPLEVAPLVASVNDLLTRLHDSLATQSAFWPMRPTSSRHRWRACACRPTSPSARAPAPRSSSARCSRSAAPASARRTPSTSCWRWHAPRAAA